MKKNVISIKALDFIVPAMIVLGLIMVLLTSCKEDNIVPSGNLDYLSECLVYKTDSTASTTDSVYWSVIPEGLKIERYNAAFNCCITSVNTNLQWVGDTLIITEDDVLEHGGCNCNCLYDFTYTLDLTIDKIITVIIEEPMLCPGDTQLVFTIDPSTINSGSVSETRSCYPWLF